MHVWLCSMLSCCFFQHKTAYEMRISDWSSDVCSSDLLRRCGGSIRSRPQVIDGEGYTVNRSKPSRFAVGDRVFHQKFGMCTVQGVDGDKLEIGFDHAGVKKVVETFVSTP